MVTDSEGTTSQASALVSWLIRLDIHREYQIEMDKQAEMRKKKSLTTLMKPAVPPKYQIKSAPIIATMMQAPVVEI
uniref:Uncharacterized protein n=1 Tax=Romanomermis culicivorax TaxID=13658 RepID=A0A915KBG7_ROMCU